MPEPVVLVEGLTRCFGNFIAVDHVNFSIQAGEIVGYLGPNGCGKTTTIRMLLGLLQPSEGCARVLGYDVFKQSEDVRARVGYMSQKFALYDDLTVLENLRFYGGIYNIHEIQKVLDTIALVGLSGHESALARDLSAGWRQRLALAISLVHRPRLLFLDEPTSGVDPTARRSFWDLIYQLAQDGVTVLVTTHYMDEAEYCGRIGMMRAGKLLAMDTPANLKATIIQGSVWDVLTLDIEPALAVLSRMEGVLRVGMTGDGLRVITRAGIKQGTIHNDLEKSIRVLGLERSEPTLEDVFLLLAKS